MDLELIYAITILIILVSIQYTLNLILREIKSLRISLIKYKDIDDITRR